MLLFFNFQLMACFVLVAFVGHIEAIVDVDTAETTFCTFYCNALFQQCLRDEKCTGYSAPKICIEELDDCFQQCRYMSKFSRIHADDPTLPF